MKLTKFMRECFVTSVMLDVPQVDYNAQMQALAVKDAVDRLPPKIRAIYDDPKLMDWIKQGYTRNNYVHCAIPSNREGQNFLSEETQTELKKLDALNTAQHASRRVLREKLNAVAFSVNTRKALLAALPEFEKYLPEDEVKACRTLPVVQNVVSDFVKAGWPKK